MKQTAQDTCYFAYHVKGEMVRIDELNKNKQIVSSLLVNLKDHNLTALSPTKKLYMKLRTNPYVPDNQTSYEIIPSKNKKKIFGYDCQQWRVKNKKQNTEVSYWVANDEFCFFGDLMKLLNKTEKHSTFFLQIPNVSCYGPLVCEERTLLRDSKVKLAVIDIKKSKLDNTLFVIPANYKNFER